MDKIVKAKWIAALTSGEYSKTKGALKDNCGFCALGVLCDIYAKEHNIEWEQEGDSNMYLLDGNEYYLPKFVQEWAGVNDSACGVMIGEEKRSVPMLNDGYRNSAGYHEPQSFEKIACFIQENL